MSKNSIPGENKAHFLTIKRIVSSFQYLILCVFYDFEDFLTNIFKTHECYDFLWYNGSVRSEIFTFFYILLIF